MRTVIFDLDGTLADTTADLIAAANVCFMRLGLGEILDPARDQQLAVKGGRMMLARGFDRVGHPFKEADLDEWNDVLRTAYGDKIDVNTTLYPGARAAVERLNAQGYRVGVCTNKPAYLAEKLLERLGVRPLFGSLIGPETVGIAKPDPAPLFAAVDGVGGNIERCVLVGDSVTDHKTARAAGVSSLLVTFGPDGHGISQLDPDGLLHHYDDLGDAVQRLIG